MRWFTISFESSLRQIPLTLHDYKENMVKWFEQGKLEVIIIVLFRAVHTLEQV